MRKCKIDNRRIPCPNASLLGFNRGAAKRGDLITYNVSSVGMTIRTGRVLGRVSSVDDGLETVNGFALVMEISSDHSCAYQRWINPQEIMSVSDACPKLAAFFHADKLPSVETILEMMESGALSERYIGDAVHRMAHESKIANRTKQRARESERKKARGLRAAINRMTESN